MPLRTRDAVKQDLQRSIGNLEAAKEKIGRWIEVYAEHHPEIAAAMAISIQSIDMTIDFVDKVQQSI